MMTSDAVRDARAVLDELLRLYPAGRISALFPNGNPATVPDDIALGAQQVRVLSPGLAGYAPEDRPGILAAFDRALAGGVGHTAARAINAPDVSLHVHLVDMTDVYGVVVAVSVVQEGGRPSFETLVQLPVVPPRVARIRKAGTATIVGIDDATTAILGWGPEEMVGRRSLEFIHPDDQHLAIENWLHLMTNPSVVARARMRHQTRDGSWIWFETAQTNQLDRDEACVLAEMVDISVEMAAQQELEAREQLLYQLTQTLPLGVFQIDTLGRIIYTNQRLFDVVGLARAETLTEQLAMLTPEHQPVLAGALHEVLHGAVERTIDVQLAGIDGTAARMCQISLRPLQDHAAEIVGAVGCVADVTESTLLRRELEHRATFDSLTGCHNRAAVMSILDSALLEACKAKTGTGVIFIDLDRFKSVNDRLGHAAGNRLLVHTAETLRAVVAEQATIGRVGGDEFLIVCPNTGSSANALSLADRVAKALRRELQLAGATISCWASVGVSWSNAPAVDGEALVAEADAAMYESKRLGRGQAASHPVLATPPKQLAQAPFNRSQKIAHDQAVQPRGPHPSEKPNSLAG